MSIKLLLEALNDDSVLFLEKGPVNKGYFGYWSLIIKIKLKMKTVKKNICCTLTRGDKRVSKTKG